MCASCRQLPSGPGALRIWGGPWPVPQPAPGAEDGSRAALGRGAGASMGNNLFFLWKKSFPSFFFGREMVGRIELGKAVLPRRGAALRGDERGFQSRTRSAVLHPGQPRKGCPEGTRRSRTRRLPRCRKVSSDTGRMDGAFKPKRQTTFRKAPVGDGRR